jgi:hypothetical protein
MDPKTKQRRAIIMLVALVAVFGFVIFVGSIIMFLFELNSNPEINDINDSFRSMETVFHLAGQEAIYPVTVAGRILSIMVLVISVALLVGFAAQVFRWLNLRGAKTELNELKEEMDEDKKELIREIDENEDIGQKIIEQQEQILHNEQSIIAKLDKLRQEKHDRS